MSRYNEVIAISLIKDIRFKSIQHYQAFLIDLKEGMMEHEIIEMTKMPNGEILARIMSQYNHKPMIKLNQEEKGEDR